MSGHPPQQGTGQYDNSYGQDGQEYYHDDQAYYDQNNPQLDPHGQEPYYDDQQQYGVPMADQRRYQD
jgi:hypothetical protein